MNQHSIENSGKRYSHKRNSYDTIKTSFSLKNAKRSLPQVCVDLIEHNKKNRLALQQRPTKGKEPTIQISYFDDRRKGHKAVKKKDQLTLKNMYQTQLNHKQDDKKSILTEYREEIEQLKLENQRLKEENQQFSKNEEYVNRKIKEVRQQKYEENRQLRDVVCDLEQKVEDYSGKIKSLYEELIFQKRRDGPEKHAREYWTNQTIGDARHQAKGQLYSYRLKENKPSSNHFKRMTSPSSSELDRLRLTQEVDTMMRYERKGQSAYYKSRGGYYRTIYSDAQ